MDREKNNNGLSESMHFPISHDAILAEFDRRHAAGLIYYDANPEIRTQTVNGFQVRSTDTTTT